MKAIDTSPLFLEINSEEAAVMSSDLSALGVTAVVLLTNKEPNLLIDQGNLESQWHSYVKVRDQLGRILGKMLAEKPQDHYQSDQEVLADVPTPRMELHIEIDQASLKRQVAEIEEMDYFQQLQIQAEELRNSVETDPAPQLEAEVPQHIEIDQASLKRQVAEIEEMDYFQQLQIQAEELRNSVETDPAPQLSTLLLGQTAVSLPSGAINPDIQPEAAMPPKLTPAFINRCRQEIAHHIGPKARHILEDIPVKQAKIFPAQLFEALAAEIRHPQQAIQFWERLLL